MLAHERCVMHLLNRPVARCRSSVWPVACRFVFKRTGRDLKTCVQLIRQGNKQLFLSSVERFQQLHADAMLQQYQQQQDQDTADDPTKVRGPFPGPVVG